MTSTPAVGVIAGSIGERSASLPWAWPVAVRSVLLVPALVLAIVCSLALGPTPTRAAANSLGLRATYEVSAYVNWTDGWMSVSSTARIRNTTAEPVGELTFNLLPLRLGRLQLLGVVAGGFQAQAVASDQSLIVSLPAPLAPDEETTVTIDYNAFFNTKSRGKKVLFMKKRGIVTAYRWIPWLSREQPFKSPNFGETWVTAVSPRVTVQLTSDVPLDYATSGVRTGGEGLTQTFVASDVRDFNFSASPEYRIRHIDWNGVVVSIFYRDYSPDRLWSRTRTALERYSSQLGPYPYATLTVAETPAGVGMESPGMIWVDATLAKSRFAYIVGHEMAHQWFYAAVGNNQAYDPFVDEAVADFLTRDLLGTFRSSLCATSRLDRPVYEYSSTCYAEIVYVQGGLYLKAYHDEVGADAFWTGLSGFYGERRLGIADTRGLLDYLDAVSGYDSARHRERFPSLY